MRHLSSLFFASALFLSAAAAKAQDVTIFAAASLTNALQEAGEAYRAKTGKTVKFSFASSSVLAKQVEAGAPAQIFISADEKWMDYAVSKGVIQEGTRINPIGNTMVLIAPADSKAGPVEISAKTDIASLLGDGRLATGDPAHVPVGTYAKEAFEKLGLWTAVEPKLARAENVRAALALVETGEAPIGVVYATDAAASKKVKVLGAFPKGSHAPIVYPFAIVKGQKDAAQDVFAYITGPEGIKIFTKYGFAPLTSS
jgi:molybdate transport system substrate-binding protein